MPFLSSLPAIRWMLLIVVLSLVTQVTVTDASAQALNPREKRALENIQRDIDRAGRSFLAKQYSTSARAIQQAIRSMEGLLAQPRPELLEAIRGDHARLEKAHRMLTDQGQDLPAVPDLPAAAMNPEAGEAISFSKQVATILVARCGNCHVNQSRGDFSAASHQALMNSTTIATGKPDDSRLIEVIVSGEMPKGGGRVPDEELATLKAWIAQGARFDGEDASQNLRELTGAPARPTRGEPMKVTAPTGNETVSFGIDVAPILMENCGECHRVRNPRGNFSMANFRTLLRGGDGGPPIVPGKSGESHLIKRLRGDGVEVMPPFGKIDDGLISTIATWIDEGARFDGPDPQFDLEVVAATVKAAAMSHEELVADRDQLAVRSWKLAMGNVESQAIASDNFRVFGASKETRLPDLSELCESLAKEIRSTLKLSRDPIVKGNISVFAFSKRYDFSEFQTMVIRRDLPGDVTSYWDYDVVDAYTVLLMTRNQEVEELAVPLTRRITALHLASQASDVPRWFADGVGWWTAQQIHARDDSLQTLEQRAEQAVASMKRPDDFVQDRLPNDQAGLVAYLFIRQLRANSAANFNRLMGQLADGQSFDASFREQFGATPAELIAGGNRRNSR